MDLGTRLWSVPAGRLLSGQAHVFDDGVALTTWRGKPRAAYRWEQVADLWYDAAMRIVHEESVGSMITQATHKLTFGFGDGDDGGERVTVQLREDAVRTLASDFFRHGIRQRPTSAAEVVVQHVRDRVASIQLPRVQEKLAAGGVVDFGVLSATADELRHGGQALPWQQVSWLGFLHRYSSRPPIDHGGFACIYYDRDEHWFDVPAAHVSNLQTLEQLFDSIPRVPKRLAATGDYEPPGGELAIGTLYFRCAACGIIGGERSVSYGEADDGDYDWPIDYACRCGHTGQLARADALPRDSEWTCTQRACDTIFPVPTGASTVTCPVCRASQDTGLANGH